MASDTHDLARRSQLGLPLLLATAALGATTLTAALAYGLPTWLALGFGILGAGALAGLTWGVVLPNRRAAADLVACGQRSEELELALEATIRRLQAGDLASGPETGLPPALAAGLNAATATLATLVQQIQSSSVEVAAAGNTVRRSAQDLAAASTEEAAAVVELTATTEELARTAAQIASNAAAQAAAAGRAQEAGNAGATAVGEAVAGVEAVIAKIDAIAGRTDTLASRAREIYRLLDLITDIAQETHILSLNAAIEAAAAGEHGRRFGVVAEEVRRLAQRSRESVDSVRTMLEEFSATTRATAVATEEGSKEGVRVLERARAAATAIEELRRALADTARAAREISLATEQQRTASDQVAITLKEVSQVVQRVAEGMKTFSATAERLNQLALTIQLLTQAFRTPSPRSLKHLATGWAAELGRRAGHWEGVEAHLAEFLRGNKYLELAYLVDREGMMVAYAASPEMPTERREGNISVGTSYADRPWFQAVQRDRRAILTPLYQSLLTGEACFTVAVPVWGTTGELAGVLGVDVNARDWTRL